MRFNVYREAKVSLYIFSVILAIAVLFYFFASIFTSMGFSGLSKDAFEEVHECIKTTVIIDPGHGGEDPGAVANGIVEKDINLSISTILNEYLTTFGFETAMSRSSDKLLYNSGEENRKKYYDIRNREAFANSYSNALFVSVHMNKFPAEYCNGFQTFYSENNNKSKLLADSIQQNARILQYTNQRKVLSGNETIYLLDALKIPAVLVECGFTSNVSEAMRFKNIEYHAKIAFSIFCGISEYLEKDYED
jgi:N-acetylmuramoyl-L-alanine amidase